MQYYILFIINYYKYILLLITIEYKIYICTLDIRLNSLLDY